MFKIPISSLKDVISFIKPSVYVTKNEDGIAQRDGKSYLKYFNFKIQEKIRLKPRCYVKYLYGDEAYSTSETKVKQRVDFYVRNKKILRDELNNSCKIEFNGKIFDIIYINFLGEFIEIRGELNYEITN